jgi:hypothetical protein
VLSSNCTKQQRESIHISLNDTNSLSDDFKTWVVLSICTDTRNSKGDEAYKSVAALLRSLSGISASGIRNNSVPTNTTGADRPVASGAVGEF